MVTLRRGLRQRSSDEGQTSLELVLRVGELRRSAMAEVREFLDWDAEPAVRRAVRESQEVAR